MANRLKELRQARKKSRAAFAREMGVDQSTVWRWEQDIDLITNRDLKRAALLLGVRPADIDPDHNLTQEVPT